MTTLQQELTFDADTHAYQWRGERFDSVTQVLRNMGLCASTGTQSGMDRGTAIHLAIHQMIKKTLDWDLVTVSLAGYLRSVNSFFRDHDVQPIESEIQLASPQYRVAGTIDLIAKVDGLETIIDYKTVAGSLPRVCERWWHLQRGMYYVLALENEIISEDCRTLNVALAENGKYRIPVNGTYGRSQIKLEITDDVAIATAYEILNVNRFR